MITTIRSGCALLFFVLVALNAHAGTISGKIVQQGSDKAVANAQIRVEGATTVAHAAADGSFSLILPPGDYRLRIFAAHFESSDPVPITVTVADTAPLVIRLTPAVTLPTVTVEAERNPDKVAKTVISGKELAQVAGTGGDPLKALQALPGIAVLNDASSEPAIRGSGPEDNAYYIDFLRVGYLFHMGGLVSVINADLVDDFNLYSSAYGPEFANVLGGIIDVNLRRPREDRIGGKLNINFYEADALIEGPVTENQSFFFGIRRSYFDLILPKTGRLGDVEYREFPSYNDYQGKYLVRLNAQDTLSFQVSGAGDQAKLFIPVDSDIAQRDPAFAGDVANKSRYDSQGAVWTARAGSTAANKLALGHLTTDVENSVGTVGYGRARFNTYFLRENFNVFANARNEVNLGTEYVSSKIDLDLDFKDPRCSEFTPDCDFTSAPRTQLRDTLHANSWALYAKDRWRAAERLTLIGGLRASREDYLDEMHYEPRLGAEWQWDERTLLTAGWGRYHQFPDGLQVVDQFGNPDLSTLKGRHTVVGIERKTSPSWSVKTEAYYKTFEELVVPDTTLKYVNGGSGRAYGLDVLVRKAAVQDKLSGWLALTLGHSERTNDLTGETFDYSYDQPVILTWVATYHQSERWSYGAKWRYHTGSPFTPIVGTGTYPDGRIRAIYGAINSERLPAYHRLDLRADRHFQFSDWRLNVYGELINAYNHDNISGYTYNADYTDRKPIHQLPIFISFGVQAEF